MRGHCKRQANLHPAAEVFQGSIQKAFNSEKSTISSNFP